MSVRIKLFTGNVSLGTLPLGILGLWDNKGIIFSIVPDMFQSPVEFQGPWTFQVRLPHVPLKLNLWQLTSIFKNSHTDSVLHTCDSLESRDSQYGLSQGMN